MPKDLLSLELPLPIVTERLQIRSPREGDGRLLYEAVEESRQQLSFWLHWPQKMLTIQESDRSVSELQAKGLLRQELHLFIFSNEGLCGQEPGKKDKFVGGCGLHPIQWESGVAAIGYWCRKGEQGKGYMREAVAALTRYAFEQLGLERIELICHEKNERSNALARSLGYVLEGKRAGAMPQPPGLQEEADASDLACCYARLSAAALERAGQWKS